MKRQRLRKKDTPPDQWIAHRKLRKKIASAKWYASKKKELIHQQRELQKELEAAYQLRRQQRLWTPDQFAYWRAVREHHYHGFPVRPMDIPVHDWIQLIDLTYAAMARMLEAQQDQSWLAHPERRRVLKRLAFAELLKEYKHKHEDITKICDKCKTTEEHSSIWSRVTRGVFPSICSTIGWIYAGYIVRKVPSDMWTRTCTHLHTRMEEHTHSKNMIWLDEDLQVLRRAVDRMCMEPVDDTPFTEETSTIPGSLDSYLYDTFGDLRDWTHHSLRQETESTESQCHETHFTE